MLEVKVKGPALKLQGQWKFKGETAIITEEEYKENEEYLELVNGEIEMSVGNTKKEKTQGDNKGENGEDKELETLREKAKELGIRGAHNMKKENLIDKIEEAEKTDNTEDDEHEGEDEETGKDSNKGEQPQE